MGLWRTIVAMRCYQRLWLVQVCTRRAQTCLTKSVISRGNYGSLGADCIVDKVARMRGRQRHDLS